MHYHFVRKGKTFKLYIVASLSPKYTLITCGKREQALKDLERLVDKKEAKRMYEVIIKEAVLSQVSYIY